MGNFLFTLNPPSPQPAVCNVNSLHEADSVFAWTAGADVSVEGDDVLSPQLAQFDVAVLAPVPVLNLFC